MSFRGDIRQRGEWRKKEVEEKEEADPNQQLYAEAGTEIANVSP